MGLGCLPSSNQFSGTHPVKLYSKILADLMRRLIGNLQNTAANLTPFRNIAIHRLTSGFMQLAAAGCRHNMLHFHCLFEGKMILVH